MHQLGRSFELGEGVLSYFMPNHPSLDLPQDGGWTAYTIDSIRVIGRPSCGYSYSTNGTKALLVDRFVFMSEPFEVTIGDACSAPCVLTTSPGS